MSNTWWGIHNMRRLLKAIKCNQNCLDGSPRWLNNRQGNKGNLSADGPLVTPWTRPRATCSYDRTGCYFIAAAIIISAVILVKNWVHVCVRICPSVCFFAAVFVLVCVQWQFLGPAGLHLVFCPMLCLALWGDKYLKSRGNPVSPAAEARGVADLH